MTLKISLFHTKKSFFCIEIRNSEAPTPLFYTLKYLFFTLKISLFHTKISFFHKKFFYQFEIFLFIFWIFHFLDLTFFSFWSYFLLLNPGYLYIIDRLGARNLNIVTFFLYDMSFKSYARFKLLDFHSRFLLLSNELHYIQ